MSDDESDDEAPPSPPDIDSSVPESAKRKPFKLVEDIEIDFTKIKGSYDISKPIDWEGIKLASVSEDNMGGDGVFFLQTKCDRVFILKGGMDVADEIFSSKVSRLFEVESPMLDLIEYKPKDRKNRCFSEKHGDKYGVDWYGAKVALARCGEKNLRVKLKLERSLDRAFYLKMEFCCGLSIYSRGFIPKHYLKSKKHLNDIGKIYVFDLIQNNFDRFPVPELFKHQGNLQNVLFLKDSVVAIDQSVNPFKEEKQKKKYLSEIKRIVRTCYEKTWSKENIYVDDICEVFKRECFYDILEDGRKEIWIGIMEQFRNVSKNLEKIVEEMEMTYLEIKRLLTGVDWENVFEDSLRRIDLRFIERIMKVIRENYKEL